MRLIIAGSRSITDIDTLKDAFGSSPFEWEDVDVLVNGDADGVDSLAQDMVEDKEIELDTYPAEDFIDKAPSPKVAPLIRNSRMAEEADALLAVWNGESSGTEDMIDKARKEELDISIHRTDTTSLADF